MRTSHAIGELNIESGQCAAQFLKPDQMLVRNFKLLASNFCEMLFKRDGEDKAHREALGESATIVLYGVRDPVNNIADTQHCAANLDVRTVSTTAERLPAGNADADIEVVPIERKCICISLGVDKIAKRGRD